MANERANPLDFSDLSDFKPEPRKRAIIEEKAIAAIAAENRFTSREAPATAHRPVAPEIPIASSQAAPTRRKGRPRTGRNVQFNAKVTLETNDKAYELVERISLPSHPATLGELLQRAFLALERELNTTAER